MYKGTASSFNYCGIRIKQQDKEKDMSDKQKAGNQFEPLTPYFFLNHLNLVGVKPFGDVPDKISLALIDGTLFSFGFRSNISIIDEVFRLGFVCDAYQLVYGLTPCGNGFYKAVVTEAYYCESEVVRERDTEKTLIATEEIESLYKQGRELFNSQAVDGVVPNYLVFGLTEQSSEEATQKESEITEADPAQSDDSRATGNAEI